MPRMAPPKPPPPAVTSTLISVPFDNEERVPPSTRQSQELALPRRHSLRIGWTFLDLEHCAEAEEGNVPLLAEEHIERNAYRGDRSRVDVEKVEVRYQIVVRTR